MTETYRMKERARSKKRQDKLYATPGGRLVILARMRKYRLKKKVQQSRLNRKAAQFRLILERAKNDSRN